MTKRKAGKLLYFGGATLLCIALALIIVYFAFLINEELSFLALLLPGIFASIASVAMIAIGYRKAYCADLSVKRKWAENAALPHEPITNFKNELETIRTNFKNDTDPNKNITEVFRFFNSGDMYDFNVINIGEIYYGFIVDIGPNGTSNKNVSAHVVPAALIYSKEPYFEENPYAYTEIMYRMRSSGFIGSVLANGQWLSNMKLPPDIAGAHEVYLCEFMSYRPHLPLYCLSDLLVPVIAAPHRSTSVFIADYKYWSKNYIGNFSNGKIFRSFKQKRDIENGDTWA